LFFGSLATPERNARTIEEFRARYAGEVEVLEAFAGELRQILAQSPDHLYYLLTVLFGLKVYGAYLDWADEALALLGKGAK
ncbi:MAG: PadR family transcriptional regulator, partial [Methanocella sp.]